MRFGNIEARWSEINKKYELVQWFVDRGHCWVIGFFDRHKEGYDFRTVSDRYHKSGELAHVVAGHMLAILNELHESGALLDAPTQERTIK